MKKLGKCGLGNLLKVSPELSAESGLIEPSLSDPRAQLLTSRLCPSGVGFENRKIESFFQYEGI